MEKEILSYFLPTGLLEHFIIVKIEEKLEATSKEKIIEIELEEKNEIPVGYDAAQYESKGFYPAKRVQDFPIRGKAVYLLIKRRRWRHKIKTNDVIESDFSLIAEGAKLTKEVADFLKGTGRDPSRYS
jgi:hypothetical protein